jgi:AraC-like DNA-binding protein
LIHRSTLSAVLDAFERVLVEKGIDPETILARAGITSEERGDPDARFDIGQADRLWRAAFEATDDPCLGFWVGRAVLPANLHALGFAWLSSRTLREGLQRFARYHRLLSTAAVVELEDVQGGAQLLLEPARPHGLPQGGLDASFAMVVGMCRAMANDPVSPLQVQMTRPEPPCSQELRTYFGCEVEYEATVGLVVFPNEVLDRVLPRQNPALAQANDQVATNYLAKLDKDDIRTRVREALLELMVDGKFSRAVVADRLHMSTRTLQRRLVEEGTSFKEELDNTRHELAIGYMRQQRMSVGEACFLLGFADQSNFSRAFRRWTGKSPMAYRTEMSA